MPVETEVFRVEYDQAAAGANAEQFRRKIAEVEAQIDDLRDAMERGATIADAHYQRSMAELTAELAQLQAAERRATEAIAEHLNTTVKASAAAQRFARDLHGGAGEATRGLTSLHYQLFTIGQLLDDLQYVPEQGLRPIIGQLFQIHPAIGAIALGIDQAIRRWDTIEAKIKGSALEEPVGLYAHYFRELAESIGLASSKTQDLEEQAKAAAEALSKIQGAGAKERTQAFQRTVEEFGGGDDVLKLLLDEDKRRRPGRTAQQEEAARKQLSVDLIKAHEGNQAAIERIVQAAGARSTFSQAIGTNTETFRRQVQELEAQQRQDQAEAEAANRERQQRIAERAKALAGREIGERVALGEIVRTGEVQDELAAAGVDVDAAMAEEIRQEVVRIIDEEAAKRALAEGKSPAAARAAIARGRQEERDKEAQAEEDRIFKNTKVIEEDEAEERRKIEQATAAFAAQAQLGILRGFAPGARSGFTTTKQRDTFREDLRKEIIRATQEELLNRGEDPVRAAELAAKAPRVLSDDLQEQAINLQARGLDVHQRHAVLTERLAVAQAQQADKLYNVERRVANAERTYQVTRRTVQNRGRP